MPVTRPIAVRQVAAGLATGAALLAASGLGLSLDTTEWAAPQFTSPGSVSRLAWGERVSSSLGSDFSYPSVTWGGPLVLAVALLGATAACALVAARVGDSGPWVRLTQLLAIAGGALLAGVFGVLWVIGSSDVSAKDYANGLATTTEWGPLMAVLGLAGLLAAAAAVTVRRGRAIVLATVQVVA